MKFNAVSCKHLFVSCRAMLALCLSCLPATSFAEHNPATHKLADEDVLTFGVYAHIRSTAILGKFSSITRHLEQALAERGIHKHVHLKIYSSYPQAIEALASGEVDFARYGPVSYILSKRKNQGIRLLAMESNAGEKSFSGVIAVASESPLQSINDLQGRRIAFGDRNSTTGRYLSQAALVEAGLTAADFDQVAYLGRHDKVAFAVASGNYDAGAMNENTFNKYKNEKGLRSILKFDCVTKPWVAREGLDATIYHALRQILLDFDDPELLEPLKREGLLPADDNDYDAIRKAMHLARQFDELQLVFGTYASQRPAEVFSTIRPVLDAIVSTLDNSGLHASFDIRVFPTYTDAINSITSGAIDIARLGTASYVIASDREPGLTVLAQENSRSKRVEGVFIVRKDASINTLQDLHGKTLAFANEHSTEGRYLSQAILVRAGITEKSLLDFNYLGRHDKVAYAVAAGNYDAGVLRSTILERTGLDKSLRSIMRFSVPEKIWVARQGLGDDAITVLREAFTSLDHHPALQGLGPGLSGFVYPPVDDFERLRGEMALSLDFRSTP